MTTFFVLSQRRTRSSLASGPLKWHSNVLGQIPASTCYFYTQFLDVTRHLASTGSERELLSRNYKLAAHFANVQAKVLHTHSASKHDVTCAGEKALMETRLTAWNTFGNSGSMRRSHRARLMFIHERYHHHQEQQCTTVFVSTCKSKNGRDLLVDVIRQSGGGSNVIWVCAATDRHSPCFRKSAPSDQV